MEQIRLDGSNILRGGGAAVVDTVTTRRLFKVCCTSCLQNLQQVVSYINKKPPA